jgi:hypothetical protein
VNEAIGKALACYLQLTIRERQDFQAMAHMIEKHTPAEAVPVGRGRPKGSKNKKADAFELESLITNNGAVTENL